MKKIILTGGGTAGHVIPNLALVPSLKAAGFEVFYIGSHAGIERGLVEAEQILYFGISSGKLRRYIDLKNITDMFRIAKGLGDAARVIRKIKPDIIFSKGGFVTVPVIAAARLFKIKSILHESDITPGLANKLSLPFATKICCSFPETLKHVSGGRGILTGSPIRESLKNGDRAKGLRLAGFLGAVKPVLLITGGSQGATAINACVREALPKLTEKFHVIHLCGKGNLSDEQRKYVDYIEFEYLSDAMPDVLAAADIVISRAGANTLFELLALKKPHLLIPLSKGASRGDQILNAESMAKQGFSKILPEEEMTAERLLKDVEDLYNSRNQFKEAMEARNEADGVAEVMKVIISTIQS